MARIVQSGEALRGASKLVIFGGSFDPPHRGHVELPRHVQQAIGADAVVYVPAARSPHKPDRPASAPSHRLAMLQAALNGLDDAVILTDELDRADEDTPSYTVDTLERLRQTLGEDTTLRLLIGADQVPAFDHWHQNQRIVELAEPVVMLRPPFTRQSLLEQVPAAERDRWADRLVEVPAKDVSATEIRDKAGRGEVIDHLVPEPVARYIEQHGLYQPEA
jgi:nicotinate-nucleotide adenylyltransferase